MHAAQLVVKTSLNVIDTWFKTHKYDDGKLLSPSKRTTSQFNGMQTETKIETTQAPLSLTNGFNCRVHCFTPLHFVLRQSESALWFGWLRFLEWMNATVVTPPHLSFEVGCKPVALAILTVHGKVPWIIQIDVSLIFVWARSFQPHLHPAHLGNGGEIFFQINSG